MAFNKKKKFAETIIKSDITDTIHLKIQLFQTHSFNFTS